MTPARAGTGDPVAFFVRQRIKDLFKNLPLAIAGHEEQVHQIRVASRRLRVVLPVVMKKARGKRVKDTVRRLRDLTRIAGESRDLDVGLALVSAVFPPVTARGEAARVLVGRLRAARSRARGRMTEDLLDFDIAGLRSDLARVTGRGTEDLFMTLIRLRGFRQDEGETLVLQARRIGRNFDPEALHEMRSRVRRLRYASELGAALMRGSSEAGRLFKNVQEVLGELHDVWVLGLWMARQAETSAGRGRADVAGEARRAHASCEAVGRALHAKFLDLDPPALLQEALSLAGGAQSVA